MVGFFLLSLILSHSLILCLCLSYRWKMDGILSISCVKCAHHKFQSYNKWLLELLCFCSTYNKLNNFRQITQCNENDGGKGEKEEEEDEEEEKEKDDDEKRHGNIATKSQTLWS